MSYSISLFDLNFDEEEEKAAVEVIRSRWISSGPKCLELENKFSGMLDSKYAVALANCTAALHLAVLAVGIQPGDEVIVPSLTFVATANAIRYVGGIPVFCDIESIERPIVDPDKIEKLITKKTKAIMVMHYGGYACNMNKIVAIANKYRLRIIEDACHGPMSEYNGAKLGTIGDVGCFSFFSNKNISTGEGGMIVTNDDEIYEKVKLMRSHGMTTMSYDRAKGHSTSYDVVEVGFNYRLDDIRAAIGIAQLDKLIPDIRKRAYVRKQYLEGLNNCEQLLIPFSEYSDISSLYIFPVVLAEGDSKKRNQVREKLAVLGIETSVHYAPVHLFSIYDKYRRDDLKYTELYAATEFTLPMYGNLSANEVDYIVESVKQVVAEVMQ